MLPILFRLGPVTIYSFGGALALAVFSGSFLVWRQARKLGLSEEKILDILFLTIMLALLFGRAGYIYQHWLVFAPDWSRIFLVGKYPGISFVTSLASGLIVSGLLARNSNLSVFLVWDVLALAMSFVLVLGFLGCFLDNCVAGIPIYTSLMLALVALVWWAGLTFLSQTLSKSPQFSEIAKKPGLSILGYLIFQVISLLMLRLTVSDQSQIVAYWLMVLALLVFFVGRYWQLFKHLYDSISQKRPGTNS